MQWNRLIASSKFEYSICYWIAYIYLSFIKCSNYWRIDSIFFYVCGDCVWTSTISSIPSLPSYVANFFFVHSTLLLSSILWRLSVQFFLCACRLSIVYNGLKCNWINRAKKTHSNTDTSKIKIEAKRNWTWNKKVKKRWQPWLKEKLHLLKRNAS